MKKLKLITLLLISTITTGIFTGCASVEGNIDATINEKALLSSSIYYDKSQIDSMNGNGIKINGKTKEDFAKTSEVTMHNGKECYVEKQNDYIPYDKVSDNNMKMIIHKDGVFIANDEPNTKTMDNQFLKNMNIIEDMIIKVSFTEDVERTNGSKEKKKVVFDQETLMNSPYLYAYTIGSTHNEKTDAKLVANEQSKTITKYRNFKGFKLKSVYKESYNVYIQKTSKTFKSAHIIAKPGYKIKTYFKGKSVSNNIKKTGKYKVVTRSKKKRTKTYIYIN